MPIFIATNNAVKNGDSFYTGMILLLACIALLLVLDLLVFDINHRKRK